MGEHDYGDEALEGEINIEEARRAIGILSRYFGIGSRADFRARFDKGAGLVEVKGVGEVREEALSVLWGLDDAEWVEVTGLPVEHPAPAPASAPAPVPVPVPALAPPPDMEPGQEADAAP